MTPPPAESVAAMIRPSPQPPDSKVNRDLLAVLEGTSLGYWLLLLIAVGTVGLAVAVCIFYVFDWLWISLY